MTTQSEPTGTPRTDVEVTTRGTKTLIQGVSVKGKNWIIQNMCSNLEDFIIVEKEYFEEIRRYILGSGLTILER